MKLSITARHFKANDELQQYARNETSKLDKLFDHITSSEIVLSYQKQTKTAELVVNAPRETLRADASSDDFFKSIDIVVQKMERQLEKYKEKLRKKS